MSDDTLSDDHQPTHPGCKVLQRLSFGLLFALTLLPVSSAWADGWIFVRPRPTVRPHRPPRPDWGGLTVTRHHVDARVDRGVARVVVKETFHNPHPAQLEGTYFFPLPPDSQIDDFRAVLGGQELAGEILPRDEARRIYEGLVRQVHDPALLEYWDRGLFRARVFPIPARGDVDVTISYRQTLHQDGGFSRLRYPLDTGRFTAGPYQDVQVKVRILMDAPIRSVTSPSHPLEIRRISATEVEASFTATSHTANKDFLVDILTSRDGLAGGVRAFKEGSEDGYFLLRLAPGAEIPTNLPPTTIVFVVDTSGSMAGRKMENARHALTSALARLRPQDRFQILTFESRVRSLGVGVTPATPENLAAARAFVGEIQARGGTDIDAALTRALADAGAVEGGASVLLISDGAPTVGETNPAKIVSAVTSRGGGDYRVHVFGVGHDVNAVLLDDLARKNGGSRTYLQGDENLELAISGLVDKVTVPCLNDLRVEVEDPRGRVRIREMEPRGPYDLFFGEDLVVAGRYQGDGPVRFRVVGESGGVERSFLFPVDLPGHGGQEEAAYLWAQYRIYGLLDEMRGAPAHEKPGLKKEIVELGLRFGLVTPYTSFLIREDDGSLLSRRVQGRISSAPRARSLMDRSSRGFSGAEGKDAFGYSRRQSEERASQKKLGWVAGLRGGAPATELEEVLAIEHRGGRAFIPLEDGLHVEGTFRDGQLPKADHRFLFGSDEYLTFLRANPGAAPYLSSGRAVLFRWKGEVVRVDYDPDQVPEVGEATVEKKPPVRF